MNRFFKTCVAGLALVLMSLTGFSAQATPTGYTTLLFSGNCVDCAEAESTEKYGVTGELVLRGEDFQNGQKTDQSYFVSFSYSGSNLFKAYEITEANVTYFFTAFNHWIHIEKDLGDGSFLFFSYSSTAGYDADGSWILEYTGPWSTGIGSYVADYGDAGTLQIVSASNNVPEPATVLLLGAALVGLGLTRCRQV